MANRSNTSSPLRGLLIICLTNLLFALTDIQAKYLSQTLPIFQIAWARYLGYLAFTLLAFYPKRRRQMFSTKRLRLQIFRSMFLLICTLLFFTALSYMPIADAGAITFCSPVLNCRTECSIGKGTGGTKALDGRRRGFYGYTHHHSTGNGNRARGCISCFGFGSPFLALQYRDPNVEFDRRLGHHARIPWPYRSSGAEPAGPLSMAATHRRAGTFFAAHAGSLWRTGSLLDDQSLQTGPRGSCGPHELLLPCLEYRSRSSGFR